MSEKGKGYLIGEFAKTLIKEVPQCRKQLRQFEEQIDLHFDAVRKAASLAVYERLFALWHLLHLPLFVMLVGAVVVHILAVHLY